MGFYSIAGDYFGFFGIGWLLRSVAFCLFLWLLRISFCYLGVFSCLFGCFYWFARYVVANTRLDFVGWRCTDCVGCLSWLGDCGFGLCLLFRCLLLCWFACCPQLVSWVMLLYELSVVSGLFALFRFCVVYCCFAFA